MTEPIIVVEGEQLTRTVSTSITETFTKEQLQNNIIMYDNQIALYTNKKIEDMALLAAFPS